MNKKQEINYLKGRLSGVDEDIYDINHAIRLEKDSNDTFFGNEYRSGCMEDLKENDDKLGVRIEALYDHLGLVYSTEEKGVIKKKKNK